MKLAYLLTVIIACDFFRCNTSKNNVCSETAIKEFRLEENVKIIVHFSGKFSDSLTYSRIEIWIGENQVFKDTTSTEYLFDSKFYPQERKLKNGNYEVLMKVFNAPNYNKIQAFYFKDNQLDNKLLFPLFQEKPIILDGKPEYFGVMNISEPPCYNCDSCFYNPTLYYEKNDLGIVLDTIQTVKINTEKWGGFYGFKLSNKILHCK